MYTKIELAKKYLLYWFKAGNGKGHGIHSPFVYDFIKNVLNKKVSRQEYAAIEVLRKKLLKDQRLLHVHDFGAGSSVNNKKERTVASIAKTSLKQKKYGQLIYKIIQHYKSDNILELGTSLGITTSYMAKANRQTVVKSLEGAPAVAQIAKENFKLQKLDNIDVIEGNFNSTLLAVLGNHLARSRKVGLAYIDGNHQETATLMYFFQLLPLMHNDSIVIFDDIHWSAGMERAWHKIKSHEAVTLSIDLFFLGIVFFKNEFREKQNFIIRF